MNLGITGLSKVMLISPVSFYFNNNNINNNKKLNFKGKIIDAHVHCGQWNFDNFPCEDVVKFFSRKFNNGKDYVEKVIISNLDCIKTGKNNVPLKDEIGGNLLLLNAAAKNPKFAPFVVCQPGYGSAKNIEALLKQYPELIKGFKFHPACLDLAADDVKYFPYMELAQKYNKPCLFHSEVISDNGGNIVRGGVSDPERIYRTAKSFQEVPVILGHMGLGSPKAHEIGVDTLVKSIENNDAKLYADLAWVDWDNPSKPHIVEAIDRLRNSSKGDMTERLLFGTDAPLGVFGEKALKLEGSYDANIQNIKKVINENFGDAAKRLIDKIFYRNSKELLNKTYIDRLG